MAEKVADIFLKIRLLQMLPVQCNSLTNVQTNLNIELHNLVGGFIRTFRFDVQEQDEKVEQVTAPDRIHREGYCCRVCSQGYQGKEESL